MKAGVNTYCFGPMLLDGEMGLAQVIQFIGRETVAECFEVLARFWDKGRDEAAQARDAKRVLESVGLEVSCYSLDSDFAVYDRAQRRACVDQCIRRLDTALILGTHVIRLDPRSSLPPGTSPQDVDVDDLMARMAESAREIADAAAAKGIT
ncbi:MAG: TIM barrel protein, partial [Armatimonadetes bacterium]|nr:TIM barrel protein [Armatimonadota bacterium]